MARCDNWPRLLADYIEERRAMPFAWGSNDCSLFVADWVLRLTGIDAAESFRGEYTNAREAAALVKECGGMRVMVAKLCEGQGWPEVGVKRARRGDVLLVDTTNGEALAICTGELAVATGPDGLVTSPTLKALAAWRID